MNNIRKAAALTVTLAPLVLSCPEIAPAQEPPVRLTLKEAIRMVVQQNLDVKVELYNPAMAQAEIQRNLGIFDPLLNLAANYTRTTSATVFFMSPIRQDIVNVDAGMSQLLPTGGTAGATFDNAWNGNSLDYYNSSLNLTLSQPLLKNFGREMTELNISVARYNKEGALDRFRSKLSDTVAQVRSDYFRLYSLREDLEVKKTSYSLAARILEETRGRVKAGVLPAMEILNAEFGVATREKDVIDAEHALNDQMDLLRLELQLGRRGEIVPVDTPTREKYPVVEDEALTRALAERPELASQRVTVSVNDLQQRAARNRTLPDLTLNANVGLGGFDPTYSRNLEKMVGMDYPVWGIGLQFSYPLGNRAAENEYIRSKLQLEQSQTQLQSLEATISNDVKTAIRALQSSYKQLDVTSRGRAYAEERLKAFQKKNAVGLATTKDVFDVLNDVVTARGNQIKAVVDYNNALTQLWHATGELLDRQGIKISEHEADPLYYREK